MFASRLVRQAAPAARVLSRNIHPEEYYPRGAFWGLELPNYNRMPMWKLWWVEHFTQPNIWEFGGSWATFLTASALCVYFGYFDHAPLYRYDQYYMNGERYRIINAWYNQGKRPALEMAKFAGWVRYTVRGMDHPFSLNERTDLLFKQREQYLIARNPGVQYPYVFRNFSKVNGPDVLKVQLYPAFGMSPKTL